MRWKLKAGITGTVSMLPESAREAVWLRLHRLKQRRRPLDHRQHVQCTLDAVEVIGSRVSLADARVMQIGNRFSLTAAVVPWLLGAERTVVVDKHRCLASSFARSWARWLAADRQWLQSSLPGADAESERRISRLLEISTAADPLQAAFAICGIDYLAPGDAGDLDLPDAGFDVHMSTAVLEHLPPPHIEPRPADRLSAAEARRAGRAHHRPHRSLLVFGSQHLESALPAVQRD